MKRLGKSPTLLVHLLVGALAAVFATVATGCCATATQMPGDAGLQPQEVRAVNAIAATKRGPRPLFSVRPLSGNEPSSTSIR
ncbi:MAG: hypothetical protein EXR77_00445 [Myxococcales bacterium]|nr:hypothetical protein [Myxococcales bacterium]